MSQIVDVTGSRVRRELLRLYFGNPSKEYYLRELERLLVLPVGNIRRELLKLEKAGLFKTRRVANLVYYSLNKRSPLYREVAAIVAKTIGVEESLRTIVETTEGIYAAILYGSFAAGTEMAASDVDLLVVGRPDERPFVTKIDSLEKKIGREINYVIYSVQEYRRRKRRQDSFLKSILTGPRIVLKGNEDEL